MHCGVPVCLPAITRVTGPSAWRAQRWRDGACPGVTHRSAAESGGPQKNGSAFQQRPCLDRGETIGIWLVHLSIFAVALTPLLRCLGDAFQGSLPRQTFFATGLIASVAKSRIINETARRSPFSAFQRTTPPQRVLAFTPRSSPPLPCFRTKPSGTRRRNTESEVLGMFHLPFHFQPPPAAAKTLTYLSEILRFSRN